MRPASLFIIAALWVWIPNAQATDDIPYGFMAVDLMGTELSDDDGAFADDFDDRSAGLRISAGYRANHFFGVEGSLQSFGEFESDDTQISYNAIAARGLLYIPLVTRVVEPYVRGGAGIIRIEDRGSSGRSVNRVLDTKPMVTAGAGLQFNFSETVAARAGVDGYAFETRVGSGTTSDGSIDRSEQVLGAAYVGIKVMFR